MEQNQFDKHMVAATFAEAGEHEIAKNIMDDTQPLKAFNPEPSRKKPVMPTLIFGSISICAYILLFKNESLVTNTFTMGGWHAVFPVGAAFLFSFIHGAFASNLLSVLGLEAKK